MCICLRRFLVLMAALALAACGAPADRIESGNEVGRSTSEPALPTTSAVVADQPQEALVDGRCEVDIRYPEIASSAAVLLQELHRAGDAARRELVESQPDATGEPMLANGPCQLGIDFSLTGETSRFISVREEGMANLGGAHPVPIAASFVYDKRTDAMLALPTLFSEPDLALEHLSRFARKELAAHLAAASGQNAWPDDMRGMLYAGTEPGTDNFSQFAVLPGEDGKAMGLQLLFPPYQVAPYVYGTQTVDVPVAVFSALLQPEFAMAFHGRETDDEGF